MKIKYEAVSSAVAEGYFKIEREIISGWTQDEITDQVCFVLQKHGAEILDIPANCMEKHGKKTCTTTTGT